MKFKKYIKKQQLKTIFETKLSKVNFMGTDGISTIKFKGIIEEEISIIKRKVDDLSYKVAPYAEKLILKGRDKAPRMISIPTNRDKLTFTAVRSFLQDTYKDKLFDKSVYSHIREIKEDLKLEKYDTFSFEKNSDKSTIGTIYKDKFQFLGYEFDKDNISVRESSIDKLRSRIIKVISSKDLSKKEKLRKLNLKITGCIYEDKQYGWLYFFRLMDDMKLLYSLDNFVQKILNQYKVTYKNTELKKFTKAYYEMKNPKSKYIPIYKKSIKTSLTLDMKDIIDLKNDVEFY